MDVSTYLCTLDVMQSIVHVCFTDIFILYLNPTGAIITSIIQRYSLSIKYGSTQHCSPKEYKIESISKLMVGATFYCL